MESEEFKLIDKYIEDVEENLGRRPAQSFVTERHLIKLHLVLERLIRISGDTKDQQLRSSLTTLEHRARRCMGCIKARHTDRN